MSATPKRLFNHFYRCVGILGPGFDCEEVLLPLIFYKILSDTFQDRLSQFSDRLRDERLARERALHDVFVPDEWSWKGIPQTADRIIPYLEEAYERIDQANADQWGKTLQPFRGRLPRWAGKRLKSCVEHLETVSLSTEQYSSDVLGKAFSELARTLVGEGRRFHRRLPSPKVADLLVRLVRPPQAGRIHDPFCGSGHILARVIFYVASRGYPLSNFRITGYEQNLSLSAIARMSMFTCGVEADIVRKSDRPEKSDHKKEHDVIVGDIPLSVGQCNPKTSSEKNCIASATLLSSVRSLRGGGRISLAVPSVSLSDREGRGYREQLVRENAVEAVLELSRGVNQDSKNAKSIVILSPASDVRDIYFLSVGGEGFSPWHSKGGASLTADGMKAVVEMVRGRVETERGGRLVGHAEIRKNDYSLQSGDYTVG